MAPDGIHIRMMEPGEAEALRAIDGRAGRLLAEAGHLFDAEPASIPEFVAFLLRHEVFVAEEKGGGPVGFAAAADLGSLTDDPAGSGCYWLSGLSVDPAHGRRGIGSALLGAVVKRAGWFFHRAVGLSTARDIPFNEGFYAARGFLRVEAADWTPPLAARFAAEVPRGVDPARRVVMVRWI